MTTRTLTPKARAGPWTISIEWKPQDLWIGAYWTTGHCWICLLPTLPIHIARNTRK